MALTRTKKSEILEELKTLFTDASSIGFTTNSGLTVEDVTDLRVRLREVNSTFTLAKKTLIKIAFKEVNGVELDDSLLPQQIAIVASNDDAVAGLGKVNDFMKKKEPGFEKMEWTGSYFEGEIQDASATKEIAAMPSRETLLSRLVGSLQSPLSGFARFLDAAATELDSKGKATLGELDSPAKEEKAEEKTEEKVEEKKEEAPKEEVKEEAAPKEEVKEEAAPKADSKPDDLTKIEGVGPKIAETLVAAGVVSYADLGKKSSDEISEIIKDVRGSHATDTWPKQAEMAAEGKWDELKKWQDELDGGKPAA